MFDQSFWSTQALKSIDFGFSFILYFREVSLTSASFCDFRASVLRTLFSRNHFVLPSDLELRQLMEKFDRGVLEQPQLSTTNDLRRTLPYHTSTEESCTVNMCEPRERRVLEGVCNHDSDDEIFIAPEFVEASKQPPFC